MAPGPPSSASPRPRHRGGRDVPLRPGGRSGEAFTGGPDDVVSWEPRFADAAASGDLGFTVGDAVFDLAGIPTFYTKYLTVWQKQDRAMAVRGRLRQQPAGAGSP